MKRIRTLLITALAIGAIVAVLLHNKAISEAKSKNDILVAPAVTLAPVTSQVVADTLSLVGSTVAIRDVDIVAEAAGRIASTHFTAGDRVGDGTVLFQIDDEVRRAGVVTAEAVAEKAHKDLQRLEWLRQEKTAGDAQYEGAKLAVHQADAAVVIAKRQLADTKITAPFAGVTTSRLFDAGGYVHSGAVVANIVDISSLKVKLNVPEQEAFRLHEGQHVALTSSVYPGATFNGTVSSVSAKGDDAHTFPVIVTVPNSSANPLRAGMFMQMAFASSPDHPTPTIPRSALVGSIREPKVFVVENNVAHLRPIVVAGVTDDRIAIAGGLNESERVVISGQNNVKDGSQVTVVE